MINKVLSTIKKFNMIEKNDNIIIGLSGGADSVSLLWILNNLKEILGCNLYCIHINHGLRGKDADNDALFSKDLCETLNIPLEIINKDIKSEAKRLKISEEEAGRNIRYEAFYKKSYEFNQSKIAIGHHMNDNAETVLFNIIRGSGLKGLGGIRPIRDKIIRPLIECSKDEIEEFCLKNLITYRKDLTNELDIYSRNKLRIHLIPYIEDHFNKNFIKQLNTMSKLIREDEIFLDKLATCFLSNHLIEEKGRLIIPINKLIDQEEVIKRRIILKSIYKLTNKLKDIEYKHIEAIITLTSKDTGKRINLPNGIMVEKEYNNLCFKKSEKASIDKKGLDNEDLQEEFIINTFLKENFKEFPKSEYTKWFDYDKIKSDLTFRNRKAGDYIYLKGVGRKTLKNFFIDEKIPRNLREKTPLVVDGDSNVIWIVGYRINEEYKITNNTKKILEITFLQEE